VIFATSVRVIDTMNPDSYEESVAAERGGDDAVSKRPRNGRLALLAAAMIPVQS
jgi:hypothetical protein